MLICKPQIFKECASGRKVNFKGIVILRENKEGDLNDHTVYNTHSSESIYKKIRDSRKIADYH